MAGGWIASSGANSYRPKLTGRSVRRIGTVLLVSARDQMPVRVLVVDDSVVYQYAICAVVAATPGFEVVGTASSGREALDLAPLVDPQLVLLDVQMPDLDGIATEQRFRFRHPDVVVLLLTAGTLTPVDDGSVVIEDKGDLSPRWLADFWRGAGAETLRRKSGGPPAVRVQVPP